MGELSYQLKRLRALLWESPEPVTRTIIAINLFTFLSYFILSFLLRVGNPWSWLDYSTIAPWREPWTFLTYPLFTRDPLTLIFASYWLWIVGGALERSWGSRDFLRLFWGVTLATSMGLWVGSLLLGAIGPGVVGGVHAALSGLWLPLAGLTVAWCLINPEQIVLLGFVLPIKGRHLMWVTVALTYFLFAMGFGAPWLAFPALAGVGVSYVYTRRRLERVVSIYGGRASTVGRPPTRLERAIDWLAFYWERWRRRLRR
jgi:membrane associated rhomboid family serine protease